ncbi:MAG: hypothetical protein ABH952_09155 [Candidatus Omnitrophota bacterium]
MNKNSQSNLLDTITNSEALNLAADDSELAMDQFIDNGILKDIPVFGTIIKLYRVGVGINGYLFTQKLLRFLKSLKDIPEQERINFIKQMDKDPKFKKKVSDHVFLLIDRMDDIEKTPLLARSFRAYGTHTLNPH